MEWKSWESRWAEYLEGLAAAERAAAEEDSDGESGPLPPSGMGAFVDVSDGAASGKPSAPAPEPPQPQPPPEPEVVGCVQPKQQPRRPGPPGWEARQAEREREDAQRQEEIRERQRKQKEEAEQRFRQQQERQQEQQRRREEYEREQQQQQRQRWEEYSRRHQRRQHEQQRPPPHSASSSASAPRAAAKPPKAPALGRFFDSFAAFDKAFSEWEATNAAADVIRLADVPFPPRRDPAGLVEAGLLRGGDEAQRKGLLRKALLRWHPDKWGKVIGKIATSEHAELGRRLATITQALVEQKDA